MTTNKEHWESIFSTTADAKLGWFESDTTKTYELLHQIPDWQSSRIFVSGAGTSFLIDQLIAHGAKLVVNDISDEALSRVKARLGAVSNEVFWLCQDISQPFLAAVPKADIWIDRAVLHFLLEEHEITGYFNNVTSTVEIGGYVLLAEFSKVGALKCAGLVLNRYSLDEFSHRLGTAFKLIAHFDYTFINPNGDPRPYIYALYKREA